MLQNVRISQRNPERAPNLAPATSASVSEAMILDEKKELYAEGQRYWDMIRTDNTIMFNDEHVGAALQHRTVIYCTFYKATPPIPQTELDANPDQPVNKTQGINDQKTPIPKV